MAHVPLTPIGRPRTDVLDERAWREHQEKLAPLEEKLRARREEVHAGWGEKYAQRVHAKGKLTTRERLARLADPGSELFEVGTFVNYGDTFGDKPLTSPAAGVVTAFAKVEGRWCMVIANDNTVASGSWWPRTPEKIERAQMMALRLKLPTVYLVDCSGLFLPEQSRSFPGGTGAGHIFKMNSLLSASGVPQIAGVFGDCIAGGGYMPIISDRVYMTEQAYMVIAGAALIKGAKSQKLTSLGIGGPEVHVHQSGCADVRVPDDETAIAAIRREVGRLPSSAADYYRGGAGAIEPAHPPRELAGILPVDHRESYDAMEVLARLTDQSLFWECMPHVGEEIVCGVGKVGCGSRSRFARAGRLFCSEGLNAGSGLVRAEHGQQGRALVARLDRRSAVCGAADHVDVATGAPARLAGRTVVTGQAGALDDGGHVAVVRLARR